MFLCIRSSFLDLISKIIEGHYFIWQLSVVTSCQLVYRIDVAHPTDGRHASAKTGKKRHTKAVQCQAEDGSGVWRTSWGTSRKEEKKGVEFYCWSLAGLLTHVKGSSHSWVWPLASSCSLLEFRWEYGRGRPLHDHNLSLFNPAIRTTPFRVSEITKRTIFNP